VIATMLDGTRARVWRFLLPRARCVA